MFESLPVIHESRFRIGAAAALLALTGSACGFETGEPEQTPTNTEISDALEKALAEMKGKVDMELCRLVIKSDMDCDGVADQFDVLDERADLGDDDGDLVTNVFDLHSGENDFQYDADSDGLIDAYDTYFGDNLADIDGDGISNGHDLQPLTPAVAGTTAEQDNRAVGNQIVLNSLANQSFQKILNTDSSVFPENTPFTTDYDGDGFNDYFDTEPTNTYITPENDVYEIGSDAWYEDE